MSTSFELAAADRRKKLRESLLITKNGIDTIATTVERLDVAMKEMRKAAAKLTEAKVDADRAIKALRTQEDRGSNG